jgi:hypothetical protein
MRRAITPSVWAAAAAIAVACVPGVAQGDTVVDLSLEEMAAHADAVVLGTVGRVEAAWDATETRIYTTVEVQVASYIAGSGPRLVTIRQVGGRVGDVELYVSGQPRFAPGERVVAFLERDEASDGSFVVMCMAAGLYRVAVDDVSGEQVLTRNVEGLARVPGPGRTTLIRARSIRPLTLGELLERTRAAVAAGGAR